MNTQNVILSSLGSAFLGIAVDQVHQNLWTAIITAIVGVLCWAAYDFLP